MHLKSCPQLCHFLLRDVHSVAKEHNDVVRQGVGVPLHSESLGDGTTKLTTSRDKCHNFEYVVKIHGFRD